MQMSLDGIVEGENGDGSWMNTTDPENWADLFEMLQTVDLVLAGRVMWPDYSKHWKEMLTSPTAPPDEVKYARIAEKTQHIVFSKTITDAGWNNAKIVSSDIVEEVKKLKQLPGKDIVTYGGARFASTLIDSGLVDEYRLCVVGAIVTKGKSIFNGLTKKSTLELIDAKKLKSGLLIVRYGNSST